MADNQNIDATKNSTDSIKKYLDFEKPIQEVVLDAETGESPTALTINPIFVFFKK